MSDKTDLQLGHHNRNIYKMYKRLVTLLISFLFIYITCRKCSNFCVQFANIDLRL